MILHAHFVIMAKLSLGNKEGSKPPGVFPGIFIFTERNVGRTAFMPYFRCQLTPEKSRMARVGRIVIAIAIFFRVYERSNADSKIRRN